MADKMVSCLYGCIAWQFNVLSISVVSIQQGVFIITGVNTQIIH